MISYKNSKKLNSNLYNLKLLYNVDVINRPYELEVTMNKQQNNTNINDTTIYMLGQTAKEKQELKDQIGIDWSTFTQVNIKE